MGVALWLTVGARQAWGQALIIDGPDSLGDLIQTALSKSGQPLAYRRTNALLAERNLANQPGALGPQGIAWMGRNLSSQVLASHPTWQPTARNVVGLDAIVVLSRNYVGRCKNINVGLGQPTNPTLAAPNNPLALILAGEGGTGTFTACSSASRRMAIADLTACAGVVELAHFYRLDDTSDTTPNLMAHLGFTRFCSGRAPGNFNQPGANMANDDSDPIRRACVPADANHAPTPCTYHPTAVRCTAGAPNDSAGRPCTQGFTVALSEADPGQSSIMTTVASRIQYDSFNTTFGYANRRAARLPDLSTAGLTLNSVTFADGNIRMNQYMLSERIFLHRKPEGTLDPARDAAENSFYSWATQPCNLDPLLKQHGFISCTEDCAAPVQGAGNLCVLPAQPAMDVAKQNLPAAAPCDGTSACAATGFPCFPPAVCPMEGGGSDPLPLLPEENPNQNALGMNTWFLSDWDGSFAFVDAMKHARPWMTNDASAPVATDSLGWPVQDAATIFSATGPAVLVNGTYRLVFQGQATVTPLWAEGVLTNPVYDLARNQTSALVTFSRVADEDPIGLSFTNTRRTPNSALNTGVTKVRLYRPGYPWDDSEIFTKPFLAALGKTRVVRMMDWSFTNSNLVQTWQDRITPAHATQAGLPSPSYVDPSGVIWDAAHGAPTSLGVAIEHQIQLCNTLEADCWINIPVLADNDYVKNLALALRFGTDGKNPYSGSQANPVFPPLRPDLRLYLEYANEIWNAAPGFYCFQILQSIVGRLPSNHPVLNPPGADLYQHLFRYPAWRTSTIRDIFHTVYGSASMMNRVRPVLMTQIGNGNGTLSTALTWLDAFAQRQVPARKVGDYLYAAGGSGYYGVNSWSTHPNLFFAPGNYPESGALKSFGQDSVWVKNFNLKHIAYEGGQGLDFFPRAEALAINADPRMQDMVVKTHDGWSRQGGDLLVYYAVRGPHEWEFTPNILDLFSPKMRALDQLRSQPRASVTLGQSLPGTMVASQWPDYRLGTGNGYETVCAGLPCIGGLTEGTWIALPGHANAPFLGNVSITGISQSGTILRLWVNGEPKGTVTLPASQGLVQSTMLLMQIPSGLVVVRLEAMQGALDLFSVSVVP